jgi:hypothetical protein
LAQKIFTDDYNFISLFSGTGPCVPFGQGAGQLQKAVNGKVGADVNFAVSAINYGYVDSGLIGAFIVSDAAAAGKVRFSFNFLQFR